MLLFSTAAGTVLNLLLETVLPPAYLALLFTGLGILPVSYTHLDVYKRQPLYSWTFPALNWHLHLCG